MIGLTKEILQNSIDGINKIMDDKKFPHGIVVSKNDFSKIPKTNIINNFIYIEIVIDPEVKDGNVEIYYDRQLFLIRKYKITSRLPAECMVDYVLTNGV